MLLSQSQRDAFEQTLPQLQALGTLPQMINGLTVDRIIAAKPLGKMEKLQSKLACTFDVKHSTRNTAVTFRYVPLGAMWFVRSVAKFWP